MLEVFQGEVSMEQDLGKQVSCQKTNRESRASKAGMLPQFTLRTHIMLKGGNGHNRR